MEEYSIRNRLYNKYNKSNKIIIKYQEYISTKKIQKLQNKYNNQINEITESYLYLQQSNINTDNSTRNSFMKYFKEIDDSKKNQNDNSKVNSDTNIKKHIIKKLKNKKVNNPRKYLENKNRGIPLILLDFIHPYEYLFNHRIKNYKTNKEKNKDFKYHLSETSYNSDKNLFKKKLKLFPRNQNNLNITPINKTEIQKNTLNMKYTKHKPIKRENNFLKNSISKIKKISKNKKYIMSTENNKTSNINIFITDNSLSHKNRKKELLKSLSNLNEKTKKIKNELINDNESQKNYFSEEKDKKEEFNLDKSLFKILNKNVYKKPTTQTIKNIFRHIKKKNSFSDLIRQYSSFKNKKKSFNSPNKKKFLKELLKMDIVDKKETFLSNYQFKNNYEIRGGINQLQEKQNSKIRKLFNKKIIKMKNLNIKRIESFRKSMINSKNK